MAKGDKDEVNRRVEQCLLWILDGWNRYRIVQYVSKQKSMVPGEKGYKEEHDWDVSERMVYKYCKKAAARIRDEVSKPNRDLEYKKAILRYEDLIRRATNKGDLRTALRTQIRLDELTAVSKFGTEGDGDIREEAVIVLPDGTRLTI